jgi:hypothetical protein
MTLYGERKYGVKCINYVSQKRMRQTDAMAPLLFNGVLGIAIMRSKVETWGPIFDKCSHMMVYALVWLLWEEDYRM